MPTIPGVRKQQEEIVERLRRLQREKIAAPPGSIEAIAQEIETTSAKIRELDAVMSDLLTAGRKR